MSDYLNIGRQRSLYDAASTRQLSSLSGELSRLQEQLSTGKRINRPSDDAFGFARADRLGKLNTQFERYQANIADARQWSNTTQERLDGLADIYSQAYAEGVRAANAGRSDFDRDVIVRKLESLRDEVLGQLNTKVDDEYLFAGNKTLGAEPFQWDFATGTDNTAISELTGERTVRTGPDRTLKVNMTGQEVYQLDNGENIISAFNTLIAGVDAGDSTAIDTGLGVMSQARDHLIDVAGQSGEIGNRLDMAEEQLDASILQTLSRKSEIEDTDFLSATQRFTQLQQSMQAALKVTSRTMQTSLVDYL